ncbi:MAG: hypothetical protein D6699_07680 [Aquificota bacterium]|nr:MAG: hypothetical protein D6699_07680 [Aquificota bacterium]
MRTIKTKGDKALAFILGLAYGYRKAHIEFVVKDIEEFSQEEHIEDRCYFINRDKGELLETFDERVTHVCVVREMDKKVCVFIYKRKSS